METGRQQIKTRYALKCGGNNGHKGDILMFCAQSLKQTREERKTEENHQKTDNATPWKILRRYVLLQKIVEILKVHNENFQCNLICGQQLTDFQKEDVDYRGMDNVRDPVEDP